MGKTFLPSVQTGAGFSSDSTLQIPCPVPARAGVVLLMVPDPDLAMQQKLCVLRSQVGNSKDGSSVQLSCFVFFVLPPLWKLGQLHM